MKSVPPPAEVARAFLDNKSPDKRTRQIDDLLESPAFADVMALKWADILRVEEKTLDARGVAAITEADSMCALVVGDRSILEWQLNEIAACAIDEVVVVTGFAATVIEDIVAGEHRLPVEFSQRPLQVRGNFAGAHRRRQGGVRLGARVHERGRECHLPARDHEPRHLRERPPALRHDLLRVHPRPAGADDHVRQRHCDSAANDRHAPQRLHGCVHQLLPVIRYRRARVVNAWHGFHRHGVCNHVLYHIANRR